MAESLRIGGNPYARQARARARKYYRQAQQWERYAGYWASQGDQGEVAIDLHRANQRRSWAREEMQRARQIARQEE